jgi:hypothetical protein
MTSRVSRSSADAAVAQTAKAATIRQAKARVIIILIKIDFAARQATIRPISQATAT